MKSAEQEEFRAMDALLGKVLWSQLQTMGCFDESPFVATDRARHIGIAPRYDRWFEESLRILIARGYLALEGKSYRLTPLAPSGAQAWEEWNAHKSAWMDDRLLRPQVSLVDTTLRGLPGVLRGLRSATDILFPDSSMELVEAVYKHSPAAEYFNEVLADTLLAYVAERVRRDPTVALRILEVGAGTGATSNAVFNKLRPFETNIATYCYSDISKAFLLRAEKEYRAGPPYITYRLFDVEMPPETQSIELAHYDVVIATNVLHATRNVRIVLRHLKAVLRGNGLLLLNEMADKNLFTHLTFGLLDGWWRYEDEALRIPGSPALYPRMWRWVLSDEGFTSICFPAEQAHALGQQIVVAESDGVVRRTIADPALVTADAPATPEGDRVTTVTEPADDTVPAQTSPTNTGDATSAIRRKSTFALRRLVGTALRIPVEQINATVPLEKYGVDSILVLQIVKELRRIVPGISSTLLFEHPTIDALVRHLMSVAPDALARWVDLKVEHDGPPTAAKTSAVSATRTPRSTRTPATAKKPSEAQAAPQEIAVIGMSGRYPDAPDLARFWENLRAGKNCVREIPKDRWDWRTHYGDAKGRWGSIYSKWGGFIADIDKFDALFFHISPREAEGIDPQERLFLEETYLCVGDAGYTPANLSAHRAVGVFVGVMNSTYGPMPSYWSIANRVSYTFGWHGPSLAIDTACSSSLTAIHLACESIRRNECECAIAGGVNLIIHPVQYMGLSSMGMLSADGCCKPFGDGADGFVDGEGVGAVLLKPLDRAIEDGDHVYGVIRGSSINHGGKTNGYTVPSPSAQAQLIARVFEKSGVTARAVGYVEAHGTGTALGDPIEIAGLSQAFSLSTDDRQFCAIGSVKSNIGHLESAAGIAGLTKVLLQLKHGELVPSLHADKPNPHIDFSTTPFVVQRSVSEWKRAQIRQGSETREHPRTASVSSFGAGGSNAHVIVTEFPPVAAETPQRSVSGPAIILLSAKDRASLKSLASALLRALSQYTGDDLLDIAYTLQVGREPMEHRVAFAATSVADMQAKLDRFIAEEGEIDEIWQGRAQDNDALSIVAADEEMQQRLERWVADGKHVELMKLWVGGLGFDWRRLYRNGTPRRVPLPTYVFARERHWMSPEKWRTAARLSSAPARSFDVSLYGQLLDAVTDGDISVAAAVEKAKNLMNGGET